MYQSRSSRISKTKLARSPSFSLRISKASYLEHIVPIFFSIYSIELEFHDRIGRSICAPMLGFD
jgi:hypothetical protein